MKKLFFPYAIHGTKNVILLLVRVGICFLLFANHGLPKLMMAISGDPVQFASLFGMSQTPSLYLAIFTECLCASLVLLGLFARPAAALISLQMVYLLFTIHWNDALPVKELPLMYLLSFGAILLLGPGKYSLDFIFHRRLDRASRRSSVFARKFGMNK